MVRPHSLAEHFIGIYYELGRIISHVTILAIMQVSVETFLIAAVILMLVGAAMGAWITRILLRYPFGRNPMTGKEALIGRKARVVDKKNGYLRVFINSQVWTAESPDIGAIEKGDFVLIRAVDNLTLTVAPYREVRIPVNPDPLESRVL